MTDEANLLKEILATLRDIRESLRGGARATGGTASAGAVADDHDLDGEHGNPAVRKDPPRWTGDSFVGCNFSDCTPDYLDALAGFFDWQANKDDEQGKKWKDKPASTFKRRDAARARGWAARLRSGWGGARRNDEPQGPVNDDPLPF